MKKRKIQTAMTALLMFFLLFSLAGGKADEKEVIAALKRYYKICKQEDLERYLELMDFETEQERKALAQEAKAVWSGVKTADYSLKDLEVALNEKGDLAAAEYTLKARLIKEDSSRESFSLEGDYIMILRKKDDRWRVALVQRRDLFLENLKNFYVMNALGEIGARLSRE